jgi:hypothetical protein
MEMNRDKSIADSVMSKIENEKITPIRRSVFLLRRIMQWIWVLLTVFVGGHSLGILIYFMVEFDFRLLKIFLKTPEKLWIILSVTVWFLLLAFGVVWCWIGYRKTKNGYKTENITLVVAIGIATASIGFISYKSEVSTYMDQMFGKFLPAYQSWEYIKINLWSQPEKGFLAGKVDAIETDKMTLKLKDITGKVWQVNFDGAFIRHRVPFEKDAFIKLIGRAFGSEFLATEIRPWNGRYQQKLICEEMGIDLPVCITHK